MQEVPERTKSGNGLRRDKMEKKVNENGILNALKCPLCSARVKELPQGRATLFECESCSFKIVTTRELYTNCFKIDVSELWPPLIE